MNLAVLLASIALHVPLPAGLTVHLAPCPYATPERAAGCAYPATREVYVDPQFFDGTEGAWSGVRSALAHEIGHVWDAEYMTDRYRDAFSAQIGTAGESWLDTAAPQEELQPGETFADVYDLCSMSPHARHAYVRSVGGYRNVIGGVRLTHSVVSNTCWLLHHPPATS